MTKSSFDLPFQPIRSSMYSSDELLEGFQADDPASIGTTIDFRSYVYFVVHGRAAPEDPYAGMMEALHDSSIMRAMNDFLDRSDRPAAAIMGGHREDRTTATYRSVARLAKKLTEAGFLMASGGGPGAMEATHLGALLAGRSDAELDAAVERLKAQPELPKSGKIVSPEGDVDHGLVAELHKWAAPAVELQREYRDGGESLAVPTWHYGHEPISPFASHVAKYFQNSIREDVLLMLATNGIVFAPGRGGTLQEVFQDAAQNYYADDDQAFAPMVFFDTKFWREELPVEGLLKSLFRLGGKEAEYQDKVLFSDDIDEIVAFLQRTQPSPEAAAGRLEALGFARRA